MPQITNYIVILTFLGFLISCKNYSLDELPKLHTRGGEKIVYNFKIVDLKNNGNNSILTLRAKHNNKIVGFKLEACTSPEDILLQPSSYHRNYYTYNEVHLYSDGKKSNRFVRAHNNINTLDTELNNMRKKTSYKSFIEVDSGNKPGTPIDLTKLNSKINFEEDKVRLYVYTFNKLYLSNTELTIDQQLRIRPERVGFTIIIDLSNNTLKWIN